MSTLAVIAAVLISFSEAISANYFISNNGNDRNNGLSPLYPWRTISKLNSMMREFSPGDKILFERGSYFVGQVNIFCNGNQNNPIIFGAYGEGIDPVISGSLPIKNWTLQKDGVYQAQTDTNIRNLFMNGKQMILARYPNSGYLRVKEKLGKANSGFRDNSLKQKKDYWKGANARIRTINWAFEYSVVKGFQNGTIMLESQTSFPIEENWGYYLDNKLSELDTLNEWYYQEQQNGKGVVYLKPPSGVNPNTAFIEGSFISLGFYSNTDLINVTIRDLSFVNQSNIGIYLNGKNRGVRIENCSFSRQNMNAIYLPTENRGVSIENCKFSSVNGEALYMLGSRKGLISNNIFINTGMIPGYGTTGSAFCMSAIVILSSDSNHITENFINGVGHDGINCIGQGNLIEKNVLKNILLYLNDGGAIKSYGERTKGNIWRNNFVSDVSGSLAGTPASNRLLAYGIYADAGCRNMVIENNTVSNCTGSGIFLYEGCNENTIRNNICFNNPIAVKFRSDTRNSFGNKVIGNQFIGTKENQFATRLISRSGGFMPAVFESNTYVFPRNESIFQYEGSGRLDEYSADEWKAFQSGNEKSPELKSGDKFLHPKLFRNMTPDSVRYLLDPTVEYSDIDQKKVYSSIMVEPWTSEVLFANSDRAKDPVMEIVNGNLNFGNLSPGYSSSPKWFIISVKNIGSQITVKAPEGFLISRDFDRNFAGTLSISPEFKERDIVIFVRFSPTAEKGYFGFTEVSTSGMLRLIRLNGSSSR